MIWPFHGRASEPEIVPPKLTKNTRETNVIMRSLGFADDECGEYVAVLRERVSKILAKRRPIKGLPKNFDNLNNEARARQILKFLDRKK